MASDSSEPPASLLPGILKALGHDSLREWTQAIRKHERYSLPKRLQTRIAKLFTPYTCATPSARSVALRPLQVSFGRKRRTIPYPFTICAPIKVTTLVVHDFTLTRDSKRGVLSVQGRYGIATTPFLKPRNQRNAKLCHLIASGALFESEISPEDTATLHDWLTTNGFPQAAALKASHDEEFRVNLHAQIVERVEEFVGLHGGKALTLTGEPLVLEGDEERGLSEVTSARRTSR